MQTRHTQPLKTAAIAGITAMVAGCLGGTHEVILDAETARLEFGVVAVTLEAGDAEIVDFCVVLNDSVCGFPGGEAVGCGLDVPASQVTVLCADPLLAQWPDSWTLTSATWSAPSVPASGNLVVEPAVGYLLPSGASIVTDPGSSAYVVRLDRNTDFGPADVDVVMTYDHGNDTEVVLKAVEVMVAELQLAGNPKVIVPLGDPLIDFPNLPSENVIDIRTVAIEQSTWGRVKTWFKD